MSSFKILTIAIVLTKIVLAQPQQIQNRALSTSEMQKQNHKIVKMASRALSKNLPQSVDRYTALVAVDGVNSTLIYTYEINTGAKSDEAVIKEDKSRMKKAVVNGICLHNKRFLDADIGITYIYRSVATKRELFRFTVTKSVCPQAK
ncbi:hypothetical protein MNB_SV-6-948 [hydrothermal vent metagenome]|uniref:Uncharacterized protein n=1 Tax=hydrothermal vent metagenome TaxID=652676 RepID=A0A1W1C696_9ZZZZ